MKFTYGGGEEGFANSTSAAHCSAVMDDSDLIGRWVKLRSYLCFVFLVPPVVSPIQQPLANMTVGEVAYHKKS